MGDGELNWTHFDIAVRSARAVVHDEDIARDVALEVCAAADAEHSASYIRQWARNRAIDVLRKPRLDMVRGFDVERVSGGPSPEEILIEKQERRVMLLAVGAEAMYVLERSGEFTDEELGSHLNKSAEAVRQMRSRARRKLSGADQ